MNMYEFTKDGLSKVEQFINECVAKRKEILDAGKDTADDTSIPTINDILADIEYFIDKDGDYYNGWGVTDNYESDHPLTLSLGVDFVKRLED